LSIRKYTPSLISIVLDRPHSYYASFTENFGPNSLPHSSCHVSWGNLIPLIGDTFNSLTYQSVNPVFRLTSVTHLHVMFLTPITTNRGITSKFPLSGMLLSYHQLTPSYTPSVEMFDSMGSSMSLFILLHLHPHGQHHSIGPLTHSKSPHKTPASIKSELLYPLIVCTLQLTWPQEEKTMLTGRSVKL
jgi:hypothetical protein